MKKILAFCLAAAMILGGCGKGTENTSGEAAQADGLTGGKCNRWCGRRDTEKI